MKRTIHWMVIPLMLASCATVPAPTPGTTSSPMPGKDPVPVPASSGRSSAPSPVPGRSSAPRTVASTPTRVDSLPSSEALAVLNTIPEPLSPSERVAAPSRAAVLEAAAADTADATEDAVLDSLAQENESAVDEAAAESDSLIPIPSPTRVLGDRPGSLTRAPDSLASPPPPDRGSDAAPAQPPAQPPATPPSTPPDSCWRVQLAAPPEADKARGLREAAQSQLDVAVVIEVEGKLHKVRTRTCTDRATADRLRRRALDVGFQGAFVVKGPPR